MTKIKWLVSVAVALTFALTTAIALQAETHCPGNVASVHVRLLNRSLVIVGVFVNHAGPYSFFLDTGTQVTLVHPSLAAELHLNLQGAATVAGVGFHATAAMARVDLIEVGPHRVTHPTVLVYDIQNPHFADLRVRGVLGMDFLGEFDMLIDHEHSMLCLDDAGAMPAHMQGPQIALAMPNQADTGPLPGMLIVSARLSHGFRPVRLKLDSGMNVSFLFDTPRYMRLEFLRPSLPGSSLDGGERSLSPLPPQDVSIGPVQLPRVPFSTFANAEKDSSPTEYDGLLSTGLFRRVFISHTDHFAVLDLW